MIVEFSFGNFRSFKDIQTLHLQATKTKSKYPYIDENNSFPIGKYDLLKSKVIYGANASGKTSVLRALVTFLRIIQDSFKKEDIIEAMIEPFLLAEGQSDKPTFFQISFLYENIPFRYGAQFSNGKVLDEWLFGTPGQQEVYYFIREGMDVKINENKFKEAKRLTNIPKGEQPIYSETSLFLTVANASHRKLAKNLVSYFKDSFVLLSGLDDSGMMDRALSELEDHAFKQKLNDLMAAADLGIKSVEKIDINPEDLPEDVKKQLSELTEGKKLGFVVVAKEIFNEKGNKVSEINLNLHTDESAGTKKMFALSPFIFSALEEGKILFIDEFDARLHPRLTRKIVELFNSKITNPRNAQLIVVSHDTNLLDAKLLRRDQISLVDKDKYGASSIKSLVEFKGIRNNASFEKDYLDGKYGAVPFLNQMDSLFISENLEHA